MNNLSQEDSLYLRQHVDNPVNWHPWNQESLQKAKRIGLPIFLSIGYSACHWCHVMAHESFEDIETSKLLNKRFFNIKVDREERPDLEVFAIICNKTECSKPIKNIEELIDFKNGN